MSAYFLGESLSVLHVRVGCLREKRQVMVLREVVGVLVFEPPWSVLRSERGCLLEILLLFQLFELSVFKLWRQHLVIAQEADLLELPPVCDGCVLDRD